MKTRKIIDLYGMQFIVCVLMMLFFCVNTAEAKSNELSILYNKLQKTKEDTAKINRWLDLYHYYKSINTDSALICSLEAYRLSKIKNYNVISTTEALATAYLMCQNHEKSIKYSIEAFEEAQKMRETKFYSTILCRMGSCYLALRDHNKAFECFKKALDLSEEYNGKFTSLVNLGQVYATWNEYSQAHVVYDEALKLCRQEKNSYDEAKLYNRIAELYLVEDKYDQSLFYFEKSLSMLDHKERYFRIDCMKGITEICIVTNQYARGIKIAKQADSLARAGGFLYEQKFLNSFLSELYDSIRKPDIALKYYRKYSMIKDSIFNLEKNKQLNYLQTEFDTKQRELQIKNLEQEAGFHKKMNYVYMVVILLTIMALFFFIKNIRQKNKILKFEKEKEYLEKQKLQLELSEKHREILTHTMQINQQKEVLSTVHTEISKIIKHEDPTEIIRAIKGLNSDIKAKISLSNDWEQIKLHFEKVHPEFFNRLKSDCPELSVSELKMCAYIKLKFSIKEIGRMLNINSTSVQVSRYRLKKKFNLPEKSSFDDFIDRY